MIVKIPIILNLFALSCHAWRQKGNGSRRQLRTDARCPPPQELPLPLVVIGRTASANLVVWAGGGDFPKPREK
jgi:hypothetical protein